MRISAFACAFLAVMATGGCTTYQGLVSPRTRLAFVLGQDGPDRQEKLREAATDTEIANLLDVDAQPRLPSRLAVARLDATAAYDSPILAEIDAAEISGWDAIIDDQDKITGVSPISALAHPQGPVTLRSLRMAAARMDCELLLAYIQADSSVDNRNDASVLYWTIIGLWLSPGNSLEHKTVMQAVIIDCRTGMILGTATGDSHLKRICPLALADNRRAQMALEAPKNALASLQSNTAAMIKQVLAEHQ